MNYRIWRSARSRFGSEQLPGGENDETLTALSAYTDDELKKIADAGFNAIWLHGILHHLVQVAPFMELGTDSAKHITAMQTLIARAAKYGIKVFLYMQPPRALDDRDDFWKKHPDCRGEELVFPNITLRCMCTSTPQVQQYLVNAGEALLKSLPELAGVILITASEFAQHCFSHRCHKPLTKPWHVEITCPRCYKRTRAEVIAELITMLHKGIRKSSATAEVIAWNWSWERPEDEFAIIKALPEDVILMADFERGGYKDLLRRKHFFMDEYSIGYSGPSEKFLRLFDETSRKPMRYMAKLQLGTTHELATVVSLPIISSLYKKAAFLRKNNLVSFMGCWNFGNALPNLNVEAFNYFVSQDSPDNEAEALRSFAEMKFPNCNIDLILAAWEQFERTMYYHPFTILFIYFGVQNYTLAYDEIYHPAPLTSKLVGGSWRDDDRGDELREAFIHPEQPKLFNLDEIIERIGKVAVGWEAGAALFSKALQGTQDRRLLDELGNVLICQAIWHSTENSYRVYKLRQNWQEENLEEFNRIVEDELDVLNAVLPWVERDPRQGFHIEPGTVMFSGELIRKKISMLKEILKVK